MTYRTVHEPEFRDRIRETLAGVRAGSVTGPGRSGAVASVYASHILGVPFIPYRQPVPDKLRPVLVIDTAQWTGETIRKARRLYGEDARMITIYNEPPMVRFWYEARATPPTEAVQPGQVSLPCGACDWHGVATERRDFDDDGKLYWVCPQCGNPVIADVEDASPRQEVRHD